MEKSIYNRVILEARYLVEKGSTVRATAKEFGVSKSTVHKDLTERLKHINKNLYADTLKVLKINLLERHVRGGLATRRKYEKINNDKNSQVLDFF